MSQGRHPHLSLRVRDQFYTRLHLMLNVSLILGNLGQILGKDGWDFHTEIAEKYGPVVKIHGLFGVCTLLVACLQ